VCRAVEQRDAAVEARLEWSLAADPVRAISRHEGGLRVDTPSIALIAAISCTFAAAESVTWETKTIGQGGTTPIAKGVKTYSPAKDIVVRDGPNKDGAPSWVKSLVLDENFAIGASVHREQPLTGFGLMVFRHLYQAPRERARRGQGEETGRGRRTHVRRVPGGRDTSLSG